MRRVALLLSLLATTALADMAEELAEQLAAIHKVTEKSKRKRMLKDFLKFGIGPAPENDPAAGIYNEGVTLARAEKLKAAYLTRRVDVRRFGADPKKENAHFTFDIVRAPRWTWRPPKKHDVLVRRKAGVLSRDGLGRVYLHIWVYGLDRGDTANPGGSPKRAAEIWLTAMSATLKDPVVKVKPTRRKFNRHYGKCYTFEVSGLRGGKPVTQRCWFVLPKKGQLAMVQVESHGGGPDPELEHMLSTLRDP
ncbi:MAG: hypothetical protein ACYTGN_18905 [Planctomycetota bacterium]|jgi:hypothetical protein